MKGFAATPIIFIAVFIITAVLFLHFMNIDKQVAEGVGGEARLRKLQADALKNETDSRTQLRFCMGFCMKYYSDDATLKSKIGECAGREVTLVNDSSGLTASYSLPYESGTLIDASLNKTIQVQETISYK